MKPFFPVTNFRGAPNQIHYKMNFKYLNVEKMYQGIGELVYYFAPCSAPANECIRQQPFVGLITENAES